MQLKNKRALSCSVVTSSRGVIVIRGALKSTFIIKSINFGLAYDKCL
ncbi:hypothetical protein AO385_0500 [Moraxella catarrhalis]|uniref:Uncharacterized protein n=1 Tax=Moraxella catarrhalis TaxID=480 RepID=A0A198UT51_MORCA|nr:hypothetical protein AO383_1215 [Moraxella catarrhalis]OAU98472.1 hypothetical protein AO384_0056 [Moraxella catarrhalis]OAV03422.1 hypothetical protein AO385_0500 [Moraxella catarrhalis]